VSTAVGEWTFTGNDTRSHFSWTYTFAATSAAGRSAVRLFVATQWAGYMRRCADACVALAET
jgi:hypothetical protein